MRALSQSRRKFLCNIYGDEEDYNVSKLRSIYSDLLTTVEPSRPRNLLSRAAVANENKENSSQNEPEYTVRNFRRSRSVGGSSAHCNSKSRVGNTNRGGQEVQDQMEEEEEEDETVCFEPFATELISADDSTWKRLSALKSDERREKGGGNGTLASDKTNEGKNHGDGRENENSNKMRSDSNGNPAKSAKAIHALVKARRLESRVIELIRSLGETVVYGEQRNTHNMSKVNASTKSRNMTRKNAKGRNGNEAVFEYFCDKNMLSLLVDICKAKPFPSSEIPYSGVTWTALVKAQVLQTISILISNVSEPTSLFYLLSNNYINEVVASIVPLSQWTKEALDEILPVYISFLKTLALKLTNSKSTHLFDFFCDQGSGSSSALPTFPLFYAACEVVSSPLEVVKHDSFIHTTALNMILNLFQLPSEQVRSVLSNECYTEQTLLLSHICEMLCDRYDAIVEWMMTGSLVCDLSHRAGMKVDEDDDHQRLNRLKNEVHKLDDTFQFINDLLWCSQRAVNVRLCEFLIRFVIFHPILENLKCGARGSASGNYGNKDDGYTSDDGNSNGKQQHARTEGEAKSEASMFFLYKLFSNMDYVPLLRMIMVAILHPFTPAESQIEEMTEKNKEYVLTPALNAIAQNEFMVVQEAERDGDSDSGGDYANNDFNYTNNNNFSNAVMEDLTTHVILHHTNSDEEGGSGTDDGSDISVAAISNAFRHEIMAGLSGENGERQCALTAMMLGKAFQSKVVDVVMLEMLGLVPLCRNHVGDDDDDDDYSNESGSLGHSSTLEDVLGTYFESLGRRNKSSSLMGTYALDSLITLSLRYMPHLLQAMAGEGLYFDSIHKRMQNSNFFHGITRAKHFFAQECQRFKLMDGVRELFPDLFELEIGRIFEGIMSEDRRKLEYRCDLGQLSSAVQKDIVQVLMQRDHQCENPNEIELAKCAIRYMLLLRGLDDIAQEQMTSTMGPASLGVPSPRWGDHLLDVRTVYPADDDVLLLGRLNQQSIVGSYINVQGVREDRKFFNFSPSLAITERPPDLPLSLSSTRPQWAAVSDKEKRRQLADKILIKATQMILVVDPTELLVLKPKSKDDQQTGAGTILCCTMLTNIIAVAKDGEWLHIAMRNVEDIGVLVKKGNMALRFKDTSTCQAAKEYIEDRRLVSRRELSSKIDDLLRSQCV